MPARSRAVRLRGRAPWRRLGAALLAAALLATAVPVQAAPKPPFAVGVLPLVNRRAPQGTSWLGLYLQETLARALAHSGKVALLGTEPAAQWQALLGLGDPRPPSGKALRRMGLDVLVQGSTQEVLSLVELRLRADGAGGPLIPGGVLILRVNLGSDSPDAVVARLTQAIYAALLPGVAPPHLPQPEVWAPVQALYTLLAAPPPRDGAGRAALVARLESRLAEASLQDRTQEALATVRMEQALLDTPEGPRRQSILVQALRHATAALAADPKDTFRQALKGEIHYFLKQDYQAKTEASVARIHNPLNGLAFAVLGMAAGLSTGEANVQLKHALQVDPFLDATGRPAGAPPFQGGVLEPVLAEWRTLRAQDKAEARDEPTGLLARGIALYEAGKLKEAEPVLRQAASQEQDDYRPWLYLDRILIDTERAREAVPLLRQLAIDNPEQYDIEYYLGLALERTGAFPEAADAYRKALVERPGDPTALLRLGTVELSLSRWESAQGHLRRVVDREPRNAEGWKALGVAESGLERWKEAEQAFRKALALEPGSEVARTGLERARKHQRP